MACAPNMNECELVYQLRLSPNCQFSETMIPGFVPVTFTVGGPLRKGSLPPLIPGMPT
jgi:hypothetical protein